MVCSRLFVTFGVDLEKHKVKKKQHHKKMESSLTLPEKIYLLSIHPQKGGIIASVFNNLNYLVSGAVLLDLYVGNKIRFEGKKVVLIDKKYSDPLQKLSIEKIEKAVEPRNVSRWVYHFSWSYRSVKKLIIQSLVSKRLIRVEQKQFLFFRWKKIYLVDRMRVAKMVDEIENWIFRGADDESKRCLLSLLPQSGLFSRLFPRREKRKPAREQLKQMGVENVVSKSVVRAIRAKQVAVYS